MISQVEQLAERRATLELEDRIKIFAKEVAELRSQFNARGVLFSSIDVSAVHEAVSREARIRAAIIWNALARALSVSQTLLTEESAREAKEFIDRLLRKHSNDLQEHLTTAARALPGHHAESVDPLLAAALERFYTEVDFALLSSLTRAGDRRGPVINIYQSQGIVQTGDFARASVTINISAEERQEITRALEAAREAVEKAPSLSPRERRSVIELIDETRVEAKKEEPNRLKLRAGLQGVATAIQTLGSAPQAYGLVKGAAALLGVDLP